jgi:hypothetical protein
LYLNAKLHRESLSVFGEYNGGRFQLLQSRLVDQERDIYRNGQQSKNVRSVAKLTLASATPETCCKVASIVLAQPPQSIPPICACKIFIAEAEFIFTAFQKYDFKSNIQQIRDL